MSAPSRTAPELTLHRAQDIQVEPISWVWPGWIAAGKLNVLGGIPGTGKTTIGMDAASRVTRAATWPDGMRNETQGNVIVWSGEDDPADTLVPRLMAMGADLSRVHFVGDMNDRGRTRAFDPSVDMPALVRKAREVGDVRLLIVDPIVNTVAGDSHKNGEVRRGLAPLVAFGHELRAAVLGITHFSKGTAGKEPLDRITGSLAFGALARLVLGAVKNADAVSGEQSHLLVRIKSNIGPDGDAFTYSLESAEPREGITTSRIAWGELIAGSARDILAEAEQSQSTSPKPSRLEEAKAFLQRVLAGGVVSASRIIEEGRAAGHTEKTLRRAKDELGISATKQGLGGGWVWSLQTRPKMPKTANISEQMTLPTFGLVDHLRRSSACPSMNDEAEAPPEPEYM